jgi:indole-3-pyruvate monooxygenase
MDHETDVVIVGAGAAGLATAAGLMRRGISFELLEAGERAGNAWASSYDALRLHTVRRYSGLPYYSMPRSYPRYPTRDQVVSYLEAYARHFGIEPRSGRRVVRAVPAAAGWDVVTADATYHCRILVAASGIQANPVVPDIPGRAAFPGTVIHSREYRNAARFVGQRVLVVGAGNSGAEIAVDLLGAAREVTVAVRVGVNAVPLSLLGVPIQYWALLVLRLPPSVVAPLTRILLRRAEGRLRAAGIPKSPEPVLQSHGIPIIGLRLLDATRAGRIKVAGAVERFEPTGVRFADGTVRECDAVILATGFRPALDYLDGLISFDARGFPRRDRVRSLDQPNLYLMGFNYGIAGTLNNIRTEAPVAVAQIAAALATESAKPLAS